MDPVLQKFKTIFYEEALGLLNQMEKDLLDLETSPGNRDLIESAFRAMHTIKGVSGMYGFNYISELTHHLESLYQSIRDNCLEFNKSIFDITFTAIDHIRKVLVDETLSKYENQENHKKIMANIHAILGISQVSESSDTINQPSASLQSASATWHILIRANEQIYFRGISITSLFHDLSSLGKFEITKLDYLSTGGMDTWSIILYSNANKNEILDIFMFIEDDCTITRLTSNNLFEEKENSTYESEQSILDYIEQLDAKDDRLCPEAVNHKAGQNNTIERKTCNRISVDSEKLDHLMYLVSELITLNSQFTLTTSDSKYEKIWPYIERLENLSKQFRNSALDIRLVPISEIIVRFKRLIRDLSHQLEKDIELIMDGIDTEVDKGTLDQLYDPLMHIIRNCIDHGIEKPQIRKQKGKPATGIIKISANNSGNYVIIRIEDDGCGIDMEKIHTKAVEKGLIKVGDKPPRQELLEMIFLPGFSTAQNLTEVSGRGVGMDVVKRRITEMRGEVIVDTQWGKGTSFTLRLQQSIAIIDTLLFKVENTFFTISISDIDICMQIQFEEIERGKNTGTIPFKNSLIPFIDLRRTFLLGGQYGDIAKVIVVHNNDHHLALLTDSIIGGHQAVLKPLGNIFRNQKCISAASQLGDGRLAFMIDTNELLLSAEII